jgi:amino acid transporter
MSLPDLLFGKPLATSEERAERIGSLAGVPIFGLDALSSAAYGPEAALAVLIALGSASARYSIPISTAIIILLILVYLSYRQTIEAYPEGGGSYTVARENLGRRFGLLAGAALMIDYILVVAVGIAAGVGALVSAVPKLQPHTVGLCLAILLIITIVNLRGVREAGAVFIFPTYLFVGTLLVVLFAGGIQTVLQHGHPAPAVRLPEFPQTLQVASYWLLLRAFASGCTALTGVEAVSNGVKAFHEPTAKTAQRSLTIIVAILIVLLAGIAWQVSSYGIAATDPDKPGYESTLSLLTAAVMGRGFFYYFTIGAVVLVVCLSANTAFADFPRLCRILGNDGYLPRSFTIRGRRLVYSQGIYVLAILAGTLLLLFRGITDHLIPLFALGAFLAFTLSQAGMVAHWLKQKDAAHWHKILFNLLGAVATAITVVVILIAKFKEGAWITLLLIPIFLLLMSAIHNHYRRVSREIESHSPLQLVTVKPPLVIVPVDRWTKVIQKGLLFAISLSSRVVAIHVNVNDEAECEIEKAWPAYVKQPLEKAGVPVPELVILPSPYRFIFLPMIDYILAKQSEEPDLQVAVLVPELVEKRWYQYLLHNQRAAVLKTLLLLRGNQRIVVVNVPWYLAK